MNQEERRKRIQRMVEEIQYLATRPRLGGEANDLAYALEQMTKAVGLYTDGEQIDTLVFVEGCVSKAHQAFVNRHQEMDFVSLTPGLVASC